MCCPLGKICDKIIKKRKNIELHHSDILIHEKSIYNKEKESFLGLNFFFMKIFQTKSSWFYPVRFATKGVIAKHDSQIVVKVSSQFNISEFLNEIEIMREVDNRNIVHIIATSINLPRNILICTEFMINDDLSSYLKVDKRLSKPVMIKIFRQVSSAVLYLNLNGIIHRDLRCRNVFIGNNYFVKLGNFGLARKVDSTTKQYQIRTSIKESRFCFVYKDYLIQFLI